MAIPESSTTDSVKRKKKKHSLFKCWQVTVEGLRNHIVNKRKMFAYICRSPVFEEEVQQALITSWRKNKSMIKELSLNLGSSCVGEENR